MEKPHIWYISTLLNVSYATYSQCHADFVESFCFFIGSFNSLQTLYLEDWQLGRATDTISPVLSSITALSTLNNLHISFYNLADSSHYLEVSHLEKHLLTNDLKQALEQLLTMTT